MLAPGVPSAKVADALTRAGSKWPAAVVDSTMRARYGSPAYHPAAAFDVLDLNAEKIARVRTAVGDLNAAVSGLREDANGAEMLADVRSDVRSVRGMVRFDRSGDMPWHADRPAEAVYDAIASDARLPANLRSDARAAQEAVAALVLAHRESPDFVPFHACYSDAAGPTAHLPVTRQSYDAWAGGGVTETHNDFYEAVHGRDFARAIGAYDRAEDRAGAVA